MKFVLKKKLFLKPKQICILYTEKSQKEKKNERKEMNKGICTVKKNRIEKFETQNFRRDAAALVPVEDKEVTNKEEGKT